MTLLQKLKERRKRWEKKRDRARRLHKTWKTRADHLQRSVNALIGLGADKTDVDVVELQDELKLAVAKRVHYYRAAKHADAMVAKESKAIAKERRKGATAISRRGLEMLVREEGVRRFPYEDPDHGPKGNLAGWATFGVGHLIEPKHRGVTQADKLKWGTSSKPKSMEFVLDLLDEDLDHYEDAVNDAIRKPMRQREFDAFVALCFNIGVGGFAESTVVREFNAGNKRAAADAILMWDNPSILRPRRERERHLFLTGRYQ